MSRITLRLPDDLHRRLRAVSQRAGVSLNQLVMRNLDQALAGQEETAEKDSPLMDQVRHIRVALGDLAVELDIDHLPPHLRPGEDLPDRATFMKSLPQLEPPLSATIAADREDRL